MLPGAAATQLGIFLGYSRGGWLGGLLAGLCFVLPAFAIMLALTLGYVTLAAAPVMKGALYGLGPVVMAIFLVAVYRLGKSAVTTLPQLAIVLAAAAASIPLGIVPILAVAGAFGVLLFHSRRLGVIALTALLAAAGALYFVPWPELFAPGGGKAPVLLEIASFFLAVGAFSFGGGLTLIAFIQEHVVNQYQWLTQREFIDGLALGQLTPGPILMVSAYVGYKLAGITGAALAAGAIFLPAFVIMLGILPVFERARKILWTKAAMKGIGPAVIGVLAVSLGQMAPHALPDPMAAAILAAAVAAMLAWRVGAIKLMALGAMLGIVRERWLSGVRAAL